MFVFVCRGKQGNSYRLQLSALACQVTTQQDRRSTILCTVCFTEVNKAILIDCGCLPLLVKLLHSKIVEVQCNACGCITTLANTGEFCGNFNPFPLPHPLHKPNRYIWMVSYMSLVMRKPAFCICENKDADQLRGNREADQRLCFRYTDSTISLLSKSEISSL